MNISEQKRRKEIISTKIKEYTNAMDMAINRVSEQKSVRNILVDSYLFGHITLDELFSEVVDMSKVITADEFGINQLGFIIKRMKAEEAIIELNIEMPFYSDNKNTYGPNYLIKYDKKMDRIHYRLVNYKEVYENNNKTITTTYLTMSSKEYYERLKKAHDLKFMTIESGVIKKKRVRLIPTY